MPPSVLIPFFGESLCCVKKQNGEVCINNAYYRRKDQRMVHDSHRTSDGERVYNVYCGVHCKPKERLKLPRNPDAAKNRERTLGLHRASVESSASQNKRNGQRGSLTCHKMKMMKPIPLKDGFLNVFPNNKHQNRNDGFGCASLSPMRLGPVEHAQPNLPRAETIENYHQFNKCFPIEMDEAGNPVPEFYVRRAEAYADPIPHRHKFDSAAIKKMNKDFVTAGESLVNKPMFSVHVDRNGHERRYTYVESRFFYCKWYEKLAMETDDFAKLKQMLRDGYSMCICGYDAYAPDKDLYEHYIDPARPFGHELVLYTLLAIDDVRQFPWNRFYEANRQIYDPLSF